MPKNGHWGVCAHPVFDHKVYSTLERLWARAYGAYREWAIDCATIPLATRSNHRDWTDLMFVRYEDAVLNPQNLIVAAGWFADGALRPATRVVLATKPAKVYGNATNLAGAREKLKHIPDARDPIMRRVAADREVSRVAALFSYDLSPYRLPLRLLAKPDTANRTTTN